MAENIVLTQQQREDLKQYEDILSKNCFGSHKSTFIDYVTINELAEIYKKITGVEADCKGCAGKNFIKRLSNWYCGNRYGILPAQQENKEVKRTKIKK